MTYSELLCIKKFQQTERHLIRQYNIIDYVPINEDCKKLKDQDIWRKLYLIKTTIFEKEISLILALPIAFPYEFPKIYLHQDHKDYSFIPHIDRNFFICNVDEAEAQPNPDKPVELCCEIIEKAIKNIENGLLGRNKQDYFDEFLSYWDLETDNGIISIIDPSNKCFDVCVISLKNRLKNYSYLIANNSRQAIEWLKNIGIEISRTDISWGLYLSISSLGIPPFPKTNYELIEALKKYSPESLNMLYDFLDKHARPTLILFGIESQGKYMLGAWQHPTFKDRVLKGAKSFEVSHQKGFRRGKQNSRIELSGLGKDKPLKRYAVDRLDKKRLFTRGGEGLYTDQNYKLSIIGCGSIGSHLIADLIKIGFNDFELIDDECLMPENIARHYCGFESLGFNKSEALRKLLTNKIPSLSISNKNEDIKKILLADQDYFNTFDLNIICVGDLSIELIINEMYKENLIQKPLIFVWVEPYLQAGHAVLLLPDQEFCYKFLLDDEYKFKYRVSTKSDKDVKRESGCQSTYVPYGALDISSFTNALTRLINKVQQGQIKTNSLFTWIKDNGGENFSSVLKTFEELSISKVIMYQGKITNYVQPTK